ncbi:MAG: InlB B-repeat-containing protein [Lachnospiraceae bacterium]
MKEKGTFVSCKKRFIQMLIFLILFIIIVLWFDPHNIYAYVVASGPVTDTEGNSCGTLYWSLDSDGVFTVTGAGPGATYRPYGDSFYDAQCPWHNYRDKIRYVQFNCRFEGTSLFHLNYGASINSWFANCKNLEGYSDIPYGVTDMTATFFNCMKLTQCGSIPDTVVSLMYTFSGCESIVYPPNLPTGLREDCYSMCRDEIVHVQSVALGGTFENCTSLVTTPEFMQCTNANELIGTFYNCTSLKTIHRIPANIKQFYNSFNNCSNVRGVFACDAANIEIIGTPFQNFSHNNDYLLFVKSKDPKIFSIIKSQSGDGFRGYIWNDTFQFNFNSNGGTAVSPRIVTMEYGTNVANEINSNYRAQVHSGYYDMVLTGFGELPVPSKIGYSFAGWFYDAALKNPVQLSDIVNPSKEELLTHTRTLYAGWKDAIKPEIIIGNMDSDWHNKPIQVDIHVTDNENGGIKNVTLTNKTQNQIVYSKEYNQDGVLTHDFSYTFGDVTSKLYEGMTQWEIVAKDQSDNTTRIALTIKLDYTPPIIKTDSPYDDYNELVYDDRDQVKVWAEDPLSGVVLLNLNPSNAQNTFLDPIRTPVRQNEVYSIDYTYPKEKEIYGYVAFARDAAGNIASRGIITQTNLVGHMIRVIPGENYD